MPATTTQTWTITVKTSSHSDSESESPEENMIDEDRDRLDALDITLVARLSLPRLYGANLDLSRITAQSKALGTNAFMSPERFHEHLQMLATMVPWTDGGARTWIDAFFFRAGAMFPPSHYLMMSAEHSPQSRGACCSLTHTASLCKEDNPGVASKLHEIAHGFPHEGLFLAQGRQFMLGDDVDRAVCDMYAVAQKTGQPILRGVLTNGHDWIFLILSRNPDGHGATYKESAIISLLGRESFSKQGYVEPWPDVIALLLATWVQRCFTDFDGEEDWFIVSWPQNPLPKSESSVKV